MYIILSLFLENIKHFRNSSIRVENVAEFIDPDWGDKVKSGIGLSTCRTGPRGYMGWRPYAVVDFIPGLVMDL
jgi:hypothetical protein